jgi:L-2-hydroxyglutarate oxidase LhgO
MRKYDKKYFINLATQMVQTIDPEGFTEFTQPGIRAQLMDRTNLKLLQDFVIEGDKSSLHILNAVSPGFTCAFPFAEYIYQKYILG